MKEVVFIGELYRLIPSRFPPINVYERLIANDRINELVEVENKTNPRLQSTNHLLSSQIEPDSPQLQNWNLAPFKYLNPEGSRFFRSMRPALELSDCCQTALAVSIFRREVFLARTREAPIGLDMRMLKTPVNGKFIDFRGHALDLTPEARWELGATVPSDADGVIFHPPERPSATCYAILRNDVLGKTTQAAHYRYVWDGEKISTLYAFDKEGRNLLPEDLRSEEDALAA